MSDEFEETTVRRFCHNCHYHAKQVEKLRIKNDPLEGRAICPEYSTVCPKCGKEEFCIMEVASDKPSREPMQNRCKCHHCGEDVSYKFKIGDEVVICPKCGGELPTSTWFAIPDKPIIEFSEDELSDYGINLGPSCIAPGIFL